MSGNEIVALTGDVVKVGMSHPEPEHTKEFMTLSMCSKHVVSIEYKCNIIMFPSK